MRDCTSYKQKLTEDFERVTRELKMLGIQDKDNQKDWIATPPAKDNGGSGLESDPNDAADRVEEWDERTATLSQLERQYNDITRALQKIESGTYGTCETCSEKIEPDRLDANPAARNCKTHMEEEALLPQ